MYFLPKWAITDKYPSFYDMESATAIEQTAKVYGAMNELIKEYNGFADQVNDKIHLFMEYEQADKEAFRVGLRQEFQDFINVVDLKVMDATHYMKDHLRESCEGLLEELEKEALKSLEEVKQITAEVEATVEEQNTKLTGMEDRLAGHIRTVNETINDQNDTISNAVTYMMENLKATIEATVNEMIDAGTITIGIAFDPVGEAITLSARDINYASDLALSYDAENEAIMITEK